MSEPEKPLHVRVAEALGWVQIVFCQEQNVCEPDSDGGELPGMIRMRWKGIRPGRDYRFDADVEDWPTIDEQRDVIDRYDREWWITGPLIERYGITLEARGRQWRAYREASGISAMADHPLPTVCHLILALAAAGKLEKVKP